jgi:hypothetical protein
LSFESHELVRLGTGDDRWVDMKRFVIVVDASDEDLLANLIAHRQQRVAVEFAELARVASYL